MTGNYGREVDIFAFGIIMWECFARQRPWAGLPGPQIILSTQSGQRPAHHHAAAGAVPAEVMQYVDRCWAQHAGERPKIADVVVQLYRRTFFEGFALAPQLNYPRLQWGNEQAHTAFSLPCFTLPHLTLPHVNLLHPSPYLA